MSYSITTQRAATKAALLLAVAAAFDTQVLPGQPAHAVDREAHLKQLESQLSLLPDTLPEGKEYVAGMNGYMSWTTSRPDGMPENITSAGFGCSVGIADVLKA